MDEPTHHDETPRLVSIEYFIVGMLGYKSKITYYDHLKEPGWPQRVYPLGKPMLVYDECAAYIRQQMDKRSPPANFRMPPKRPKRGRPAKGQAPDE